jgi:hypothetical protein
LSDVIAFNDAHRTEEMPFFGQELFIDAEAKGPLTDKATSRHCAGVSGWRAAKASMQL